MSRSELDEQSVDDLIAVQVLSVSPGVNRSRLEICDDWFLDARHGDVSSSNGGEELFCGSGEVLRIVSSFQPQARPRCRRGVAVEWLWSMRAEATMAKRGRRFLIPAHHVSVFLSDACASINP